MAITNKDLGIATAYGEYKAAGGTKTRAEFREMFLNFEQGVTGAEAAAREAAQSATAASGSATQASSAASLAAESAGTAHTDAQTAANAAAGVRADADRASAAATESEEIRDLINGKVNAATQAASTASTAAGNAANSASEAQTAAQTATQKASEIVASAEAAQQAKEDAVSAKTAAQTAAQQAGSSEASASSNASAAAGSAQTASTAAQTATTKASEADQSASDASGAAQTATTKATEATTAATLAQSYAKGDTSSRAGEATDNAQYYKEQAEAAKTAAEAAAASITVDATLTQSGKAADAKATGDKITELKNDLDAINDAHNDVFDLGNNWNTAYHFLRINKTNRNTFELSGTHTGSYDYRIISSDEGGESRINTIITNLDQSYFTINLIPGIRYTIIYELISGTPMTDTNTAFLLYKIVDNNIVTQNAKAVLGDFQTTSKIEYTFIADSDKYAIILWERSLTYSGTYRICIIEALPESDKTLSVDGGYADSKTVGDYFSEIYVSTQNLWDQGDQTFTNYSALIPFELSAGTYTLSAEIETDDTDTNYNRVVFLADDASTNLAAFTINRNTLKKTFTVENTVKYVRFYAAGSAQTGSGDACTFSKIQIEEGNAATQYVPPKTAVDYVARAILEGVMISEDDTWEV